MLVHAGAAAVPSGCFVPTVFLAVQRAASATEGSKGSPRPPTPETCACAYRDLTREFIAVVPPASRPSCADLVHRGDRDGPAARAPSCQGRIGDIAEGGGAGDENGGPAADLRVGREIDHVPAMPPRQHKVRVRRVLLGLGECAGSYKRCRRENATPWEIGAEKVVKRVGEKLPPRGPELLGAVYPPRTARPQEYTGCPAPCAGFSQGTPRGRCSQSLC